MQVQTDGSDCQMTTASIGLVLGWSPGDIVETPSATLDSLTACVGGTACTQARWSQHLLVWDSQQVHEPAFSNRVLIPYMALMWLARWHCLVHTFSPWTVICTKDIMIFIFAQTRYRSVCPRSGANCLFLLWRDHRAAVSSTHSKEESGPIELSLSRCVFMQLKVWKQAKYGNISICLFSCLFILLFAVVCLLLLHCSFLPTTVSFLPHWKAPFSGFTL